MAEGEEAAAEMQPKRVKGFGLGNIFAEGPVNLRPAVPGKSAQAATERKPSWPDPGLENCLASPQTNGKTFIPQKALSHPTAQPTMETKQVARLGRESADGDQLSLNEGDIVTVLDQNLVDPGWRKGELNGYTGLFPAEEHKPTRPPPPVPVNGAPQGAKAFPAVEPLVQASSIPTTEPPPLPPRVARKVPDARPQVETDDHKARKNSDVFPSDTLDQAVAPNKPLKPVTVNRAKLPVRRPPTNPHVAVVQQPSLTQDENPAAPSVPRHAISDEPTKNPAALPSPSLPMDSPIGHAADLAELQAEVSKLRSDFDQHKRIQEKRLLDLTSELDEEKKTRLNLQVEIERLKKRLAEITYG